MDERGIRETEILDKPRRVIGARLWFHITGSMLLMVLLLSFILTAKKGIDLELRPPMLEYLAGVGAAATLEEEPGAVIAYDPANADEAEYVQTLAETLDAMRIAWQSVPLSDVADCLIEGYATEIYICAQDLTQLLDGIPQLMAWVDGGGRLALTMTPALNDALMIIARKLGITEYGADYVQYDAIRFVKDDVLPLWDAGSVYTCDGTLGDFTLAVRLEGDCEVLLETGDDAAFPLLWTRRVGKGRIAVNDTTLLAGKDGRGLTSAIVTAIRDYTIYPIINAGMMFIDDFPAPQPEGVNQELMDDYGYDIHGFYRNHWWPDMKKLTWERGLRYTGLLVETYNDRVKPPFEPESEGRTLARFYASELLQSGGELGLHGYNHMPLCLDGFQYVDEDYLTWETEEDMALAVSELYRYGQKFLPGAEFKAYVPPSNYLSAEGQATLIKTVPSMRTISGLYLPEEGYQSLVQEFREEADGTVSVPRVTSGFSLDEYGTFVLAQELLLHGVYSHFIHPDDVLDDERSKGYGWADMYANFSKSIADIQNKYPCLKWSTASEGAAAVQRYDRMSIKREEKPDEINVTLSPFYDEAWLALVTDRAIEYAENCEIYRIDDELYWVCALSDEIRVVWEAGE